MLTDGSGFGRAALQVIGAAEAGEGAGTIN